MLCWFAMLVSMFCGQQASKAHISFDISSLLSKLSFSNAHCIGGSQVCSVAVCEATTNQHKGDSTSCAIAQADTLETGYGYKTQTLTGEFISK